MAESTRITPPRGKIDSEAQAPHQVERRVVEMLVHDLQNPLAGIMAFLEIMKERPAGLTKTEHEGLEAALARCHELSEMVLGLLQLGQAERGELCTELESVDLAEVARSAAHAFAPVAERGGQRIRLNAPAHGRAVTSGDERIVRRILYNLMGNALRHTPEGTTVDLAVETEPSLRIVVEDDGPGIPREIRHKVFEPGALRRAGVPSDSGIGLAFCRNAAEALGMSLRYEKSVAGGCRFILGAREAAADDVDEAGEVGAWRSASTVEQRAQAVLA